MAKTARYTGDKLQIFAAMRAAVEAANYKLTKTDETTLAVQTEAKWVSPDGLTQNPRGEGTEMIDLVDKSINIAMVVRMFPDGDLWVVKVTPVMARFNKGIPKPEPLREGNASLPGWVESKVDTLALDIHKALAPFEVKGVPQQAPPPTETAPPAGGAPGETSATGSASAEGSAAAPATP